MEENYPISESTKMEGFEDIGIEETESTIDNQDMKEKKEKEKKKNKKDLQQETLDALQIKYVELNDKHLRLFSEFDNFRKRTLKEKIELSKTASEEIITALLPIIDDFERAISALSQTEETNNQVEGISLIYNKLKNILIQKGLEEVKVLSEKFDSDFHEAITNIPAPDESQKGKVLDVVQKGYSLNGKIIRFAKVVVGN